MKTLLDRWTDKTKKKKRWKLILRKTKILKICDQISFPYNYVCVQNDR